MAHNINFSNGKHSFFSRKEKAWHGLGQIVQDAPNSEDAIKLAGLDFEVKLAETFAKVDNIEITEEKEVYKKIKDRFTTYRTDTNDIFGIVGSRYEVVQNKDAFKFFDAIVGEGEAIYETAGALGKGETVFITAKLPDYIQVRKEDIEKYLLLTMSHDGSSAITAMFTPIRVVCNNTLNAALQQGKAKVTIRHTKSAHDNLKAAHNILGITNKLSVELSEIFNKMIDCPVKDNTVERYINKLFCTPEELKLLDISGGSVYNSNDIISTRKSNIIQEVTNYYFEGVGQKEIIGTAYGMYNAITGYFQNVKDFKGDSNKKFESNLMGMNYNISQQAFNLAYLETTY